MFKSWFSEINIRDFVQISNNFQAFECGTVTKLALFPQQVVLWVNYSSNTEGHI